MKTLLFPHRMRSLGWCLFVPALIVGALKFFDVICASGVADIAINDAAIIGIAIGALLIVCSRERVEDEMTGSIRLASMLNAIYIQVTLLTVCTLCLNGLTYLNFMAANLVLLPIIFVVIFRLEMRSYNKFTDDEEQGKD